MGVAASGLEALQALRAERFDLILLDLGLPAKELEALARERVVTDKHLGRSRNDAARAGDHAREVVFDRRQRRIALDVCPTSNVRLGVYTTYADHPLPIDPARLLH